MCHGPCANQWMLPTPQGSRGSGHKALCCCLYQLTLTLDIGPRGVVRTPGSSWLRSLIFSPHSHMPPTLCHTLTSLYPCLFFFMIWSTGQLLTGAKEILSPQSLTFKQMLFCRPRSPLLDVKGWTLNLSLCIPALTLLIFLQHNLDTPSQKRQIRIWISVFEYISKHTHIFQNVTSLPVNFSLCFTFPLSWLTRLKRFPPKD